MNEKFFWHSTPNADLFLVQNFWGEQSMYCIHCGADRAASFCSQCGKSQNVTNTPPASDPHTSTATSSQADQQNDWAGSLDYYRLLECEEPRQQIVAASRHSHPGVTGDDVLALFEAVSFSQISWSKLTHAVVPIMDKLGFRTTNQLQAVWQFEPGRILLACICSLAAKSLEVTHVEQHPESCILTAKIPLGIFTNPGNIVATLETQSGWVRVTLAATISGQWYDWGKSKRLIEDILAGISTNVIDQDVGHTVPYQRIA